MKLRSKLQLLVVTSLSLGLVLTFNNCGSSFKTLISDEQILHESLTLNKEVYINGANENLFQTGRDLIFSADIVEPPQNAVYEWSYKVNNLPQGCNLVSNPVPSMYKINCPTVTGQLVVSLVVKSSLGDIMAEPVVYALTAAPANPVTEPVGASNDVAFTIPAGTGRGSWNTADNPIRARMGQRIVITNADTVAHRMHTGGSPCPHGANILPGQTGVCVVNSAFNGMVYDHNNGTAARIYIVTTP